jgi:Protein of unknown function (DUF3617)
MKFISCGTLLLVGVLPVLVAASTRAEDAPRAGLWQFTSQDQSGNSGSGSTSFTSCIDPARSVPTDPRLGCSVRGVNRSGTRVSWAMTCTVPQGVFNSQAVAEYRGGAMDGTMTTYVPMIGGQMTQRISGRYLGPCNR